MTELTEPVVGEAPQGCEAKRAVAFFDGQNLHKAVRRAWGYKHFNFEPAELAKHVASKLGLTLGKVYVYTGYHARTEHSVQHDFFTGKFSKWLRAGIKVHYKELSYQPPQKIKCSSCNGNTWKCTQCERPMDRKVGHEKGVDVHMALDIVRLAYDDAYDVAILFTQDQDFAPAIAMAKSIKEANGASFLGVSAFPLDRHADGNRFPVEGCDPFFIGRDDYDNCLDLSTYRTPIHVTEIAKDFVPVTE